MMNECLKENEKKKPNRSHIKHLLRETFPNRQVERKKMDFNGCPMMSSIIEDWPYFLDGDHVSGRKFCNIICMIF